MYGKSIGGRVWRWWTQKSAIPINWRDKQVWVSRTNPSRRSKTNTYQSQETSLALMARKDSEKDEEDVKHSKVRFNNIRGNTHSYSKRKLESLFNNLDAYQSINSKKEQMIDDYASLRKENVNLAKNDQCIQNILKELGNDL